WIWHQHAEFKPGPEVMTGVEHLGRNHRVVRVLTDRQVADADRGLESELCLLPVQEGDCVRNRDAWVFQQVLNRTEFIGGPIPREDGPDASTQQVLPGAAVNAPSGWCVITPTSIRP